MYNYRNQLSDVDIYPSYFQFFIFLFHTDVGEVGEVGEEGGGGRVVEQGEYRGGVREAGKGRVPGRWGFLKGEKRRNCMKLGN